MQFPECLLNAADPSMQTPTRGQLSEACAAALQTPESIRAERQPSASRSGNSLEQSLPGKVGILEEDLRWTGEQTFPGG